MLLSASQVSLTVEVVVGESEDVDGARLPALFDISQGVSGPQSNMNILPLDSTTWHVPKLAGVGRGPPDPSTWSIAILFA